MEIDPKTGKYKLSHRVLMEKPEGYVERAEKLELIHSQDPKRKTDGKLIATAYMIRCLFI